MYFVFVDKIFPFIKIYELINKWFITVRPE